jgi:GABA permease
MSGVNRGAFVQNPFKSEDAAFRFVLGTIVYFALIVVASRIATWLAFIVFLVLTGAALAMLRGGKKGQSPREHVERVAVEDTWRVLVIANETLQGHGLRDEIVRIAAGVAEDVLVVCPALNSRVRTWTSDEDGAREAAAARLQAALEALQGAGLRVRGEIGDADPLQALEDALRSFSADAIVISTHPAGSSNWLEHGVVEAARARFDVPVTHVVGDAPANDPLADPGISRPP